MRVGDVAMAAMWSYVTDSPQAPRWARRGWRSGGAREGVTKRGCFTYLVEEA